MRHIPASVDHDFLVAVDKAVRHSIPKPLALVLSYPSNPTAIMASLDFYKEMVDYARKHDLILLSDVAYAEIYFDNEPPPSILQVPGAMDVAVEFTSLSKTYSMPGWRMGFAVGNERLVAALARVKSYLDYGAFTPIQVAAAAALNGPQECIEEMRQTYKARRDCLVESLHRAGWDIPSPPGTMFAWAPLPESMEHIGSLEFSKLLLEKAGVAVSPGVGFGEYGEGYRPPRAGRKRAPHPAGRPRDQEVPFVGGYAPAQRHPLCARPGPLAGLLGVCEGIEMPTPQISRERHSREGGNPFIKLEQSFSMGPRLRGDDATARISSVSIGSAIFYTLKNREAP